MLTPARRDEILRNLEGTRTARERMDGLIPEPYNTALLRMAETHARDVGDLVSHVSALEAALEMAERNTRYDLTLVTAPPSWLIVCRICNQAAPGNRTINHAPDCPFALLAQADSGEAAPA